jgi:hypothetical protein
MKVARPLSIRICVLLLAVSIMAFAYDPPRDQKIQVFVPKRLVVEKREKLRSVRIFISNDSNKLDKSPTSILSLFPNR